MAFGSYEVGVIQRTPVPTIKATGRDPIALLAYRAWSLKRNLDTTNEASHAFLVPPLLRGRLGSFDPTTIATELTHIQHQIDDLAFNLYGVAGDDRAQIEEWSRKSDPIPASEDAHAKADDDKGDIEDSATDTDDTLWVADGDGKWKPRPTPSRPLNDLIKERTSSALKAALDSLLSAPQPGGSSRPRDKGKRAATRGES